MHCVYYIMWKSYKQYYDHESVNIQIHDFMDTSSYLPLTMFTILQLILWHTHV